MGDAERSDAIGALGSHFAEGRLGLTEYEDRVDAAAFAVERRELDVLFTDLPALNTGSQLMPMYSAAEIARVRKDGKRPRAAAMGLTTIGAIAATAISATVIAELSLLFLLLIPTAFILLYVAKVGPDSWHMPSQRKLDHQRMQALRAEHKFEVAQRRQERRETVEELTNSAMKFAQRSISKRIGGGTR